MRCAIAVVVLSAVGLVLAAPVPKEVAKLKPATDKERAEVKNNLKMIMLAMHNYHDANDFFPADIVDPKTKKLLLSWRVALLPYLIDNDPKAEKENAALYQKFKLNEPWDSKTNMPLIGKLPKVFAPTRVKAADGETFYRGFAGTGEFAGVFEPGTRLTLLGITDGTSNTIGIIDAGEPVPWTKPGTDLPCDLKKPLPKLGGMIDGDFYCGLCDGSVAKVKRDFDEKGMRIAIGRNDGLVLRSEVFVKTRR